MAAVLTDCDGIPCSVAGSSPRARNLSLTLPQAAAWRCGISTKATEARGRYSCKTRTKAASFGGKLDVDQAVCGAVFFN